MKITEVALKYRTHVPTSEMPQIYCPDDALIILRSIWDKETIQLREEFIIILLNNAKKCLGWSKISIDGNNSTFVDPAHVIQLALLGNAQSLILVHNHLSGELKPLISDIHLNQHIV